MEPAEALHPVPGKRRASAGQDLSLIHICKMLRGSEGNYETVFTLEPHLVEDGELLSSGLSVSAFHNYHLGTPAQGEPWRSFSFVLRAEGRQILYSGDFRDFSELLPHLGGSDLVLLETGPVSYTHLVVASGHGLGAGTAAENVQNHKNASVF